MPPTWAAVSCEVAAPSRLPTTFRVLAFTVPPVTLALLLVSLKANSTLPPAAIPPAARDTATGVAVLFTSLKTSAVPVAFSVAPSTRVFTLAFTWETAAPRATPIPPTEMPSRPLSAVVLEAALTLMLFAVTLAPLPMPVFWVMRLMATATPAFTAIAPAPAVAASAVTFWVALLVMFTLFFAVTRASFAILELTVALLWATPTAAPMAMAPTESAPTAAVTWP